MGFYVDGFVTPVPRRKLAAYRRQARQAGRVFVEHGALQFVETMADDVKTGRWTSFPQAVKLKPGEVVFFSWIAFRSRRHRDAVNAKVIKDPRLASMMSGKAVPFDGRRMIYGGFRPVVRIGTD